MNRELQEIIKYFEQFEAAVENTVLATVVDVKGSSYRLPGARMLIGASGEVIGTVSGGCLESDVLERARRVARTGSAEVFVYNTTEHENSVFSLNMGCRGVIRILLERPENRLIDFFRSLSFARSGGLIAALIESESENGNGLKVVSRLLLNPQGLAASDFPPEMEKKILPDCLNALREKQSKLLKTEIGEFFLEFIAPSPSMLIFGAGFDAIPLAETAKNIGWHVTVIDHRAAYANRARFPAADRIIITRSDNLAEKIIIGDNDAAVVMTHNYEFDKDILRFLLSSNARYVGALGPKRRTENILAQLRAAGTNISPARLDKLYAPVGLDIGADTPESIALSIVAEIKSVLANRSGGFLRERKGSIYNRNAA